MRRILTETAVALVSLCLSTVLSFGQNSERDYSAYKKKFNFYVVNDMGRNGYYDQKKIADLMGEMAEEVGPEFVLANGDTHHFEGVESVDDPLWMTNYELIYSHPELMLPWYPTLGNHEYRGNTEAVLEYSKVSRRWMMEGRYYTKRFEDDGVSIRIVWIDTTPIIDKYHTKDGEVHQDVDAQDYKTELDWLENVLAEANEDWVIVAGHHPIYAETSKDDCERKDMQERVDPILRRHHVDFYLSGHIHNFQHVRVEGSDIDYVTNSAGALSRKVSAIEGTVFCSPVTGFSIVSVSKDALELRMINSEGEVIHTVTKRK